MLSSFLFKYGPFCLLLGLCACASPQTSSDKTDKSTKPATTIAMDIQGHRGCRGLLPENSIPAFLRALDIGVNTLELDVVISKDKQVLLSHEPFMSSEICETPDGKEISHEEEKKWNLYQMEYEEIMECDCGSKPHPRFPTQEKVAVYKPLLSEVIDAAEAHAKKSGRALPLYNIETKSTPSGDGIFHPEPKEFVKLLVQLLSEKGIVERTTIQSFDIRTLQVAHAQFPKVKLVLLIENEDGPQVNLDRLGFVPEVYSPYFELIDQNLVSFVKEKGMLLVPWTLNEPKDIQRMIDLGVDGIISDYPDRVVELLSQ